MRETLKKYCGKRVEIQGIVQGPPINHEETNIFYDPVKDVGDKYKKNVNKIMGEPFNGPKSPIQFYKIATCITDIKGLGKFNDIRENHVNIMEDLMELWRLKQGDVVFLSANVAQYKKGEETDYCLVDVQRIREFNVKNTE